MDYQKAVDWLQAQTRGNRPRGPERAEELLRVLGLQNPSTRFIHIVGTNGKGSVAAYLEAAFNSTGSGGAFTSPHLISLRERVRCNGEKVSEKKVIMYAKKVRKLSLERRPAFFDLMLGLALDCFKSSNIKWAALEAGVGGASDATMAVGDAEAVVLTNVAPDHLQTFHNLKKLTLDKAMAARPGKPLITAANGPALQIIERLAADIGAPLYVYDSSNALFKLPIKPSLAGSYQRVNASLAAATLRLMGFNEKSVVSALGGAQLPGRLQKYTINNIDVFLDGAHNPHAAAALSAELPAYHLLFGAHEKKDILAILSPLQQRAVSLTFTWPLSAAPEGYDEPYIYFPEKAFKIVMEKAVQKKEPILITGSFYLLGRLLSSGFF